MRHPLHGRTFLGQSWSSLGSARAAARQQPWHAPGLYHGQLQRQSTCRLASCRGAQACLSSSVRVEVQLLHALASFRIKYCEQQ